MKLAYDLHIHSCLSPCCSDDSMPSDIVGMAAVNKLDIIAVCDHNSCKNLPAVIKAAEKYNILVIPGMELTTIEGIHVLCYFPTLENTLKFSDFAAEKNSLPFLKNNPEECGRQIIMDENDNILGEETLRLSVSTDIFFTDVYGYVTKYGGVMVPAHIEKMYTGMLHQLGFVPTESKFGAYEIRDSCNRDEILKNHPYFQNCKMIVNSDSHYLPNINVRRNFLDLENKSIECVLKYLK